MKPANQKSVCLVVAAVLLISNIILGWRLYISDSSWRLKYSADMHEASGLLVYYDRTFRERGSWPEDVQDWHGISILHLVSTNNVDGKRVDSFASEFGGDRIEIWEAVDGSPYLALGSDEAQR